MTNHPRQREMWQDLTAGGCLSLFVFFAVFTIVGVIIECLSA
jgi:uncharacterized iron-regulated membrane protein